MDDETLWERLCRVWHGRRAYSHASSFEMLAETEKRNVLGHDAVAPTPGTPAYAALGLVIIRVGEKGGRDTRIG